MTSAIGVIGIMAYWFRGHFWLCTIVVLTIQFFGDAAGHIYFWVVANSLRRRVFATWALHRRCGAATRCTTPT